MGIFRGEKAIARGNKRPVIVLIVSMALMLFLFLSCLCLGSSGMSFGDSFLAIFGQGSESAIRIVTKIRLPEALAALIAGAGLALAGLIMQTTLGNIMASPGTLGVSNAAVFGANVSIVLFAGGYVSTGKNAESLISSVNPLASSSFAFLFAFLSIFLILGLCRIKRFSPTSVVLSGVAMGAVWSAGTTLLQFYATDVGLSAAVIWSFGDLGRATFLSDAVMGGVVLFAAIFFFLLRYRYNSLLQGDAFSSSVGINIGFLRFLSLLVASLVTAVCVSYLGVIGFVGIICPHIARKLLGENHSFLIPGSLLCGAILLLGANLFAKAIAPGNSLPIGAVTSLFGAPFFLYLIFASRRKEIC